MLGAATEFRSAPCGVIILRAALHRRGHFRASLAAEKTLRIGEAVGWWHTLLKAARFVGGDLAIADKGGVRVAIRRRHRARDNGAENFAH